MSNRYVIALSTFLYLTAWIVTLPATSSGQTQANATFEAATLRETPPHDPSGIGYFMTYTGGRITIRGCTLTDLIRRAYKVQAFQVLNAPAWALLTPYSIEAVPPRIPTLASYHPTDPKSPPPDEELVMLQNFLTERFHLKVHEEMKEGPAYALLRGDRLLRLNEPADNTVRPLITFNTPDVAAGSFFRQGFNVSMAYLAALLSRDLKTPVVDQTEIRGSYDFKFEFTEDPADPTPGAYLFQSIQSIGLQLKPIRAPARYIVVDHAQKPILD